MSVSALDIYSEIGYYLEEAIVDSSAKVILPYSLSDEDISRINRYFKTYLESDDIVCLVSNSILNIGKSGAVFTKDGFYYKGWMSLQIYHEYYDNFAVLSNDYSIFNKFLLCEVMRIAKEFIEREERKERHWNAIRELIGFGSSLVDVLSYVSDIAMNVMRIYYQKDVEKNFCELYKYTSLVYREPRLFTIGNRADYRLQISQIMDFTDEVLNDLNNLKKAAVDDCSMYLAKVLLLSSTASLFLLKTNQGMMTIGEFFTGILGFDTDFLSDSVEEKGLNLNEYGIDLDLLSSFVTFTIEYVSHWETEEDYRLIEEGNVLLDCIINIIDVMRTVITCKNMVEVTEKTGIKQTYERYMQICNNDVYVQTDRVRNNVFIKEIPIRVRNIIKSCIKMKKKIQQVHFSGIVKCAPYLDEQVRYFHRGLVGLLETSASFYDYPILSITLSDYFCSGLVITDKNIIWNYLPESPEAKIIKMISCYAGQVYDEQNLREGESGCIYLEDIVDIIACADYAFVNLCVILRNDEKYFLPISLLSSEYSQTLCEIIRTIVNQITHQKFTKKRIFLFLNEELKEKLNDVLKKYDLFQVKDRMSEENTKVQQLEEFVKDSNRDTDSLEMISSESVQTEMSVGVSMYVPDSQNSNIVSQNKNVGVLKEDSAGIASLILGICSIVFSIILIGFLHGIVGIILAIAALKKKNYLHGMAKAGLICSIIGIIFSTLLFCLALGS